jgi:predicted O-methyltransferase YrrM
MARTYTCENSVIDRALGRLKGRGLVSPDARFDREAPQNLRSQVAYRDYDFLLTLSRTAETETVRSILAWLVRAGVAPQGSSYDEEAYLELRREAARFDIPGTSITPVMERLLYMLSSLRRPRRVIGLGTYCGYALVWAVAASCGPGRVYRAEKVYGIDIDAEVTARARKNLSKLAHTDHIQFLAEDGLAAVERLEGPFDYVYLDAESEELGKSVYWELLQRLYAKIAEGGWVLAHDTTVPPFASQLEGYLAFVRDSANFRDSFSFDIDPFGLELSIK